MNFLSKKENVEYNPKKLKQEHQIDFEYKTNKDIQVQTKLSSLKNKLDILEKKIYIEQFEAQEKNKKKNTKQAEYKMDNDYDFIKIKTVRFPNTRSRLIKKPNNKDKQSHKYNSLYLLPQSKMKNKRFLIKNSSSSIINGSNRDNESYLYKNRNNSSIEESIDNCIFNINDYNNNVNKNILNKKKLEEYHKLIDIRLNLMKNKKHYKIDNIKNSFSKFKLCNIDKKHIFHNNYKNISSNFEKIKRKVLSISNKSYRCVNNYKKNKNS